MLHNVFEITVRCRGYWPSRSLSSFIYHNGMPHKKDLVLWLDT